MIFVNFIKIARLSKKNRYFDFSTDYQESIQEMR